MSVLEDRPCRCPVQGATPPGRGRPPRRWEGANLQARGWGPSGGSTFSGPPRPPQPRPEVGPEDHRAQHRQEVREEARCDTACVCQQWHSRGSPRAYGPPYVSAWQGGSRQADGLHEVHESRRSGPWFLRVGHQGPGDQCARRCVCGAWAGPGASRRAAHCPTAQRRARHEKRRCSVSGRQSSSGEQVRRSPLLTSRFPEQRTALGAIRGWRPRVRAARGEDRLGAAGLKARPLAHTIDVLDETVRGLCRTAIAEVWEAMV